MKWVLGSVWIVTCSVAFAMSALGQETSATPAPPTAEALLQAFRSMPGLSAHFVEEKRLALLTRPVRTEGTIVFAPPDRLARRVTAPTASVALIRNGELTLASSEGRETIQLNGNEVVGAFVDTFRHVLAGELDDLAEIYVLRYEADGPHWHLRLTPRSAPLRRFLDHLELVGVGRGLTRMVMVERSGDTTTTTFSDVDPQRRFSERERETLFALP